MSLFTYGLIAFAIIIYFALFGLGGIVGLVYILIPKYEKKETKLPEAKD
jgi:hypothetical protein